MKAVLVQEYRIIGPDPSPYVALFRKQYRWRWLARLFGGLGIVSLTKETFPDAELIDISEDQAA